ncbi:MAG: beta-hydroxyacyl-ACP dehydratase [Deltaproteobacteria bacterium]|nr:beta-hydroxyacyl-ACP dehydratase [Deltaproteobacteria bacterium]
MRFLMIDRITSWDPGHRGTAVKNVALSEDFFDDHFPSKPIMPGVLIIEGMAQLSGLLLEEGVRRDTGKNIKALMSIVERAKFRLPTYPGDTLEYEAVGVSVNELGGRAKAQARIRGELVAECTLTFSFHEIHNEKLEARRAEVLALWMRGLDQHAAR